MDMVKVVIPFIAAALLSACDSSNSGNANNTTSGTAEGLWQGTTDAGRAIAGLVLDDGAYWLIYSAIGNSNVIAGMVQGSGASSNGTFTSSNGKDFNLEGMGINDFNLVATYSAKSSLNGTVSYPGGTTITFASAYDSSYELTPSLTTIAGTYSGAAATSSGTEFATVAITSAGDISGTSLSGCGFTGSATPRAKGNVYNVSITFGGGVCVQGISTVTGVAHFDAASKQLTSAAVNSGRTDGFIYVGIKP